MDTLEIDGHSLTIQHVVEVARHNRTVALAASARTEMLRSYAWVAQASRGEMPVYGVNTGFGSLARVRIPPEDSEQLSVNLIRSHAAGVGEPMPVEVVRAMMLLRANALAKGVSGCRPLLVENLNAMLNAGITPIIPSQGSCGSSGDLAPLAHLGLVLMKGDHGEVVVNGERMSAEAGMSAAGITRITLEAKDGLAITNGAQLTTAIAALACADADRLILSAEVAAAMTMEALRGVSRAFVAAVHELRPYPGAKACAANLRALLSGSALIDSLPDKVQDAYSLRCTPQVLGASRDTLHFATRQISVELNAATDNPLILVDQPGENKAYSAGMFHGEPVGMAMDILKIATAEIASLAERRLYRLTTGTLSHRLPPGLAQADRPSLGMMLPQTTAAALVSENRSLAWPSSVDSIPTCEDQEDHVAMSTTAARIAAEVLTNSRRVIAIELLGAAAALTFRQTEEPGVALGAGTTVALARVRTCLARLPEGRPPSEQIEALAALIHSGGLLEELPVLLHLGEEPS
ncbi:MAG: histidine ammonia-lyase [Myxococcota bacterium]|nr:histidine ammonia-lyase [Myxococcota bacterium]